MPNLGDLDIVRALPKLTPNQISAVIEKHFKGGKITTANTAAIYHAQTSSGISALALLGITALESGWGKYPIGNNFFGWGATNDDPTGNASKYESINNAFESWAKSLKATYYEGYQANTINSIGTGNNPAGKGYAYHDNGKVNSKWATDVSSIMNTMYNTAQLYKEDGLDAFYNGEYVTPDSSMLMWNEGIQSEYAETHKNDNMLTVGSELYNPFQAVNNWKDKLLNNIIMVFVYMILFVLAVVFFMQAFNVKIPTKKNIAAKVLENATETGAES